VRRYRSYRELGEKALAQIPDEHLNTQLDPGSNSVAVIVKHVAGNLRSRFTDFLTTDGEKPDRDRDSEFEIPNRVHRSDLNRWWEDGWAALLGAIESLRPEDLDRVVTIRGEPHSVPEALSRSITHTAYHVGQIVYLARHFAGAEWTTLSIPKGMSRMHHSDAVTGLDTAR
jgi:uncharacterized damage-inducible protein DinB